MDDQGPSRGSPAPARGLRYPRRRTLIGMLVGVTVLGLLGTRLYFSYQGEARCGAAPLPELHRAPCVVATSYFHAVASGDWVAAQGKLSAALQMDTTPAGLQGHWSSREEVERFMINLDPSDQRTTGTTSFIGGTLEFKDNRRDYIGIKLVLEGDTWKVARVPYQLTRNP